MSKSSEQRYQELESNIHDPILSCGKCAIVRHLKDLNKIERGSAGKLGRIRVGVFRVCQSALIVVFKDVRLSFTLVYLALARNKHLSELSNTSM